MYQKLPFINTYSGWFLNSVMLVGKGFSSCWSGGINIGKATEWNRFMATQNVGTCNQSINNQFTNQ